MIDRFIQSRKKPFARPAQFKNGPAKMSLAAASELLAFPHAS
jgi:hypothetical protein